MVKGVKQEMKHGKQLIISLLLAQLIGLLIFTPISSAASTTNVKPIFGSSFIQYWYAQDWDQNRWTAEFTMLQEVGINEVIIQTIADTKAKYATYPTQLPGYSSNEVDMVENALTAADSVGMNVRLGLGFNSDWWSKNASDLAWLNKEAAANKAIVDEIVAEYGSHPSLTGWYISYEFSQLSARTSTYQANLNSFFKQITAEINTTKPLSIMIAPFYNSKYSWTVPLSSWSVMLQNILKGTGINIVALQDSVGAGYNTTSQLASIYSYTKKATDSSGMALYADTETYTYKSSKYYSAPQSRITTQLAKVNPYIMGYVSFSTDHYQNANVASQVSYYNDYYKYYLAYR
jgi:hypothetical protein